MSPLALLKRKLRAASRVPLPDWSVLVQAWFLLLVTDLGLRLLPARRLRSRLSEPANCPGALRTDASGIVARLGRLVEVAARYHLYPMTCLRRALVLQRLLSRRGVATRLEIGVRRGGDAVEAHAWLSCGGQPIGQPEAVAARYARLVRAQERQ